MKLIEPTEDEYLAAVAANQGREVFRISSPNYEFVAKVPNRMEMDRLRKDASDPSKRSAAMHTLVLNSIVWPEYKRMLELLNQKPMLTEKLYDKIESEAGSAEEFEVKKS